MNREREGLLLCLVSAAGFGAMPIFAKQGYAAGLELTPLPSTASIASTIARLGNSLVVDQLDVERGGERARELDDVLPAHPRPA
jgi:hypothetical protein